MPVSSLKFTRGVPPPESFPKAQLAECATAAIEADGDVVLQYGPAQGYQPLRAQIAQEAGVSDSRVIIGQGSLQLQDFCARLLLEPGSLVYVEDPTYDRALTILRRTGAHVSGLPLQDDGPDVEALGHRLAGGERPVLFYIIPDFQNPSGTVLSLAKRQQLAALAQQYGFWIVEDVPYRRLRYEGQELPSLFELAPDRVFQMSSYSKLIGPGLRVGYVILPESLSKRVAKMAEDTYINASYLNQAIVSQFIARGWLEPNIARLKALYAPRLAAMLAALETHMGDLASWHRPEGGFFVGMTLKAPVQAERLVACARDNQLELTDGRGFFANGGGDTFVRLPFCAVTPEEIGTGVERLAHVVTAL